MLSSVGQSTWGCTSYHVRSLNDASPYCPQVHTYVTIVALPWGQLGAKGIAICFPVESGVLAQQLPKPRSESGTVVVRMPAPRQGAAADVDGDGLAERPPPMPRQFTVSHARLVRAAAWLQQYNPLFWDVVVTPWQPAEVAAALAETDTTGAALAAGQEEIDIDHAVALPADPALQPGALQDALGVARGALQTRLPAEERLFFDLQRAVGRPASVDAQRALEAMAFPHHYPTGVNHFGTARGVKLGPTMYFRARVDNVDRRFQVRMHVSLMRNCSCAVTWFLLRLLQC